MKAGAASPSSLLILQVVAVGIPEPAQRQRPSLSMPAAHKCMRLWSGRSGTHPPQVQVTPLSAVTYWPHVPCRKPGTESSCGRAARQVSLQQCFRDNAVREFHA